MSDYIFSIIIPTHNSSASLPGCLGSVLSQNFDSYEIVMIDGLSNDDTVDLIKHHAEKHTNIQWTSERDTGIYDAMNKGIRCAKGEWLLFLGSDDTLHDRNVLTDVHEAISANAVDVLYGNIEINGETGWGNHKQVYDKEFTLPKLLQKNIAHQAIFYHRKIFEEIGTYSLKYRICADYDLNLRVAAQYKMVYLNRIIATFTAGGISTNRKDLPFEDDFEKNIFRYFRKMLFKSEFAGFSRSILQESKRALKRLDVVNGSYLLVAGIYLTLIRNGNK